MASQQIGVGIIGASPDRGWAARAHVPAVRASPHFRLAAIATSRMSTATAARDTFGAAHAFVDAAALARHPDVDLVVVCVKVPAHVSLVTAALAAGKHVYCEWPLAPTAAQAAELAAMARDAGVHAVIGLQGRFAPAVSRARQMIVDGRLGRILSANLYSCRAKGNSFDVPAWTAYTYDASDHAGLVEVLGGHGLDLVRHLLGPIRRITARTATRTASHRVAETGELIRVTSADQFLAALELESGAMVSVHLHDGEATWPRSRLEVAGTAGNLALTSAPENNPWAAQLQIGRLDLYESRPSAVSWRPLVVEDREQPTVPLEAENVARLYDRLAADLRNDTSDSPDFASAYQLHRLIEQIQD